MHRLFIIFIKQLIINTSVLSQPIVFKPFNRFERLSGYKGIYYKFLQNYKHMK